MCDRSHIGLLSSMPPNPCLCTGRLHRESVETHKVGLRDGTILLAGVPRNGLVRNDEPAPLFGRACFTSSRALGTWGLYHSSR